MLCVVRGDDTDADAVNTAVDLLGGNPRMLFLTYVIVIDRRLPLDTTLTDEITRAERALINAEGMSGLSRDEMQGEILQGRSIGPTIVQEAFEKNVGVVIASVKLKRVLGLYRMDLDTEYLIANVPCAFALVREPLDEGDESNSTIAKRTVTFR